MPENDLTLLLDAVEQAGETALKVAREGFKTYRKPDGSQVTDGDLAVDEVLREKLMQARPDYGWFSEEGKDPVSRHGKSRCWIVDPIDGTSNFIRGGDDWCIGAALLGGHHVIASVLFQPKHKRMFTAEKSRGSFCNGVRLLMREEQPLSVMCSKTDATRLPNITRVSRENQPFLLRLAKLAAGQFQGVAASTPKSDWDLAPATLLVTEAGGNVTDFEGGPLHFNSQTGKQSGIVAGTALAHRQIRSMLEQS